MGLVPREIEHAPIIRDLYSLAVDRCIPAGLYMEFGVGSGTSLKLLRKRIPARETIYGFDSFEGLPETWNGFRKGSFATSIRPDLPNTKLVIGDFEVTVPRFITLHPQHVSLMHIDCDLYSSTSTVLERFKDQVVPGTVVIFDELFGYAGYEDHEYKAFREFIEDTSKTYDVLGRWNAYRAVIQFS